ncbi:hypothetical protein NX722_04655 [Endozoicomonas gorgoniicola]|uniref:Uncharacterized protein n=1 Tax=Endozoicomonas gorgoniicola TaxID=1234144 RepID=A0ABT3MRF0_9GAMM|nr:hypothetical protein [Endozoicomonas gorgoniicola]MCW7551940.1 hypothetical protein [Endozoicomonas gorgoniicola]
MIPLLKSVSAVGLSIVILHSGFAHSKSGHFQINAINGLIASAVVVSIAGISFGVGFDVAKSIYQTDYSSSLSKDSEQTDPDNSDFPTQTSLVSLNNYQRKIINQYNLLSFKRNEDDYSLSSKKHRYLWARATFLNNFELFRQHIKPALFVFDNDFDPTVNGCLSPLPDPFTKDLRCNDGHLTGYCRIKYSQDGKENTLVGMLANTSDNISGCLFQWRDTIAYGSKIPDNILVTDRRYYQISVTNNIQSYKFQKHPRHNMQFASDLFVNGKFYHETLCRDVGGPATELYISKRETKGDGCKGLFDVPPNMGSVSYYVPYSNNDEERVKQSDSLAWLEFASDVDSEINLEVRNKFCAPKKDFKEFILGSVEGTGADSFCRYINAKGNAGYVAKNPDGSAQSDFMKPHISEKVEWQTFEDATPFNAIIAGFSYIKSNIVGTTAPVYFCRYGEQNTFHYGQHVKGTNTCNVSLATANGNLYAINKSTDFEVLVPAQ